MSFLEKNKKYFKYLASRNRSNNQKTARKIKIYQDNIIDDMVSNSSNVEAVIPTDVMLFADLELLTKPAIYNNYKALINNPYIKKDELQKHILKMSADKESSRIVELELQQLKSNLDYAKNVIEKYEIPKKTYNQVLRKAGASSNRKLVLEEVVKQREALNRLGGTYIPQIQPYYDLDFVSENLLRESKMTSTFETMQVENNIAEKLGDDLPYTEKTWVWTGEGKTTRHESNDGQTVPFDETFTIINDATGDVDEMMYPHDPNASASNSYICYCELAVNGDVVDTS
jgi:hypothetical protein